MPMRNRITLPLIGIASALVVAAAFIFRPLPTSITRENGERIKLGMKLVDVLEILGPPRDEVYLSKLPGRPPTFPQVPHIDSAIEWRSSLGRDSVDFEVTEASQAGIMLRDHPLLKKHGIILSRLLRDGILVVPTAETLVQIGDVYRGIGPQAGLIELVSASGRRATAVR